MVEPPALAAPAEHRDVEASSSTPAQEEPMVEALVLAMTAKCHEGERNLRRHPLCLLCRPTNVGRVAAHAR
jgi:hypothetical protein